MSTTVIGSRYEVLAEVGSGAVGVLYKAKDKTLKKVVAVKLLHASHVTPSRMIRLQKEARLLSSLNHMNLVSVYDFAMDDSGSPYIVMEYVEGGNLIDYVNQNGPLSIANAVALFLDIARGLEYAHEHGILHRDLKPSNVMLVGNEKQLHAKVIDFGLATLEEDEAPEQRITQEGALVGSPLYVSPEQAQNKTVDRRSDIYSMGCLMFFALTGSPPFRGETGNATVIMQINDEAPTLKSRVPDGIYPIEIENIVANCLKKSPDKRYQSGAKLIAALESLHETIDQKRAAKAKSEPKVDIRDTLTLNTIAGAPPPVEAKQKSTLQLSIIVAALVLIVAIPIILLTHMENEQPKEVVSEAIKQRVEKDANVEFDTGVANITAFTAPRFSRFSNLYLPYYGTRITWHRAFGGIDDTKMAKLIRQDTTSPRFVRFIGKDITGKGFAEVTDVPLKGIELSTCSVDDAGLAAISRVPTLELLVLNKERAITDDGLKALKRLKDLKFLTLRYNINLTPASAKTIASLSSLEGLDVTGIESYGDTEMQQLLTLSKLKSIGIGNTKIDKSCLPAILDKYELQGLDISGLKLTDDDMPQLLTEPLYVLNLMNNPELTDKGIEFMWKFKHLYHLILANCDKCTEQGLLKLSTKMPDCVIHMKKDSIKGGAKLDRAHLTPDRSNLAF